MTFTSFTLKLGPRMVFSLRVDGSQDEDGLFMDFNDQFRNDLFDPRLEEIFKKNLFDLRHIDSAQRGKCVEIYQCFFAKEVPPLARAIAHNQFVPVLSFSRIQLKFDNVMFKFGILIKKLKKTYVGNWSYCWYGCLCARTRYDEIMRAKRLQNNNNNNTK